MACENQQYAKACRMGRYRKSTTDKDFRSNNINSRPRDQ